MITHYQLTLTPEREARVYPEWGYHLYAALLAESPAPVAAWLHESTITPFSGYVAERAGKLVWNVSLLGRESEQALAPVIERQEQFWLRRENCRLRVDGMERQHIASVDELLALPEQRTFRLRFVTPTAFKSNGQYVNLPSVPLMLRNLMNRWNGCFADECPIEDEDGAGLDVIAAGLRIADFELTSGGYFLKGKTIPGFTGGMVLKCRLNGFHLTAANLLLHFAPYAGIGIKTALGMGGVCSLDGQK